MGRDRPLPPLAMAGRRRAWAVAFLPRQSPNSCWGWGDPKPVVCKAGFARKGGTQMDERPPLLTVVGIDVAKDSLDVALRPQGAQRHAPNDTDASAGIVTWLLAVAPEVIVVEATAGYEAPLVAELGGAKRAVAVGNPRQGRNFAKASGQLAKTDRLDAEALAHFADALRPTPRPLRDLAAQELGARLARRRELGN